MSKRFVRRKSSLLKEWIGYATLFVGKKCLDSVGQLEAEWKDPNSGELPELCEARKLTVKGL